MRSFLNLHSGVRHSYIRGVYSDCLSSVSSTVIRAPVCTYGRRRIYDRGTFCSELGPVMIIDLMGPKIVMQAYGVPSSDLPLLEAVVRGGDGGFRFISKSHSGNMTRNCS
jgi:hypothetical protein